MAQSPSALRSGLDPERDTQGWVPIAREHYNTSLIPWVSSAGKAGLQWLEARTRPSADPRLILVTAEDHALGAGGPFPKEVLKQRPMASPPDEAKDSGWRAAMVLLGLLVLALLAIG